MIPPCCGISLVLALSLSQPLRIIFQLLFPIFLASFPSKVTIANRWENSQSSSTRPGNSSQEHRVQSVIRAIRCIDVHDRQLYSNRGVETSKFYCLLEYYTTTRQCNDSWNTFRLTLLDSSTGLKGSGERKSLTPKGPIEYTAHLQRLLSAGRQFYSNGQREKQVSVSSLKGRFPALFFFLVAITLNTERSFSA